MPVDLDILPALLGSIAALVSALFVFYKWAVDQENEKNEQRHQQTKHEIRAEIYRELLELNVMWLSGNEAQRKALRRLSGEIDEETGDNSTDEDGSDSSRQSS